MPLVNTDSSSRWPLASGMLDQLITSPPYWKQRRYPHPAQIGQEPRLDCGGNCGACYVCRLRAVFREGWRVLSPWGTLWLNIGDTYLEGQLSGVPWRVAFGLQRDGWRVLNDALWHKTNPMPFSSDSRLNQTHEYYFVLAKQRWHYFNLDGIRAATTDPQYAALLPRLPSYYTIGSNPGTVIDSATSQYGGAHYAVMPQTLVEFALRAGLSPRYCPVCAAPWRMVYVRSVTLQARAGYTAKYATAEHGQPPNGFSRNQTVAAGRDYSYREAERLFPDSAELRALFISYIHNHAGRTLRVPLGYLPACTCHGTFRVVQGEIPPEQLDDRWTLSSHSELWHLKGGDWTTVPYRRGRVGDPFAGTGTTVFCAAQHGGVGVGLELSWEYLSEHAQPRTAHIQEILF